MKVMNSELEVIHADNYSIERKYRMTIKHEGVIFHWVGFMGEYGSVEEWYDLEGFKIIEPDWSDSLPMFDIFDSQKDKRKFERGRTDCGLEVEEALLKELLLQGFPEDISLDVLKTFPIDRIIFDSILKEASIKIDELHKAKGE